jgi:polyisoprenoid-binding protein YceI
MKPKINIYLTALALCTGLIVFMHFASCKHEDMVVPGGGSNGGNIQRGTDHLGLMDGKTSFDKVHSSVNWATAYLGGIAPLTGKFTTFGFNSFNFYEDNADSIYFEAYVYLNTCNTGEPGRDGGCMLGYLGTSAGAGYTDSNLAIIKTKAVVLSTTDKGYIVTADLTFRGVTKELTAKLDYVGKVDIGNSVNEYGFTLAFSIAALSDFGVPAAGEIADNVDIKCSGNFKH